MCCTIATNKKETNITGRKRVLVFKEPKVGKSLRYKGKLFQRFGATTENAWSPLSAPIMPFLRLLILFYESPKTGLHASKFKKIL